LKSPSSKSAPDDVFAEVPPVFLAVEVITKHVYAAVGKATPKNAAAFLDRLVAQFPQKINKVTTDITPLFTYPEATSGGNLAVGQHPFAVACRANGVVHTQKIPPFQEHSEPKRRSRPVGIRLVGRAPSATLR
jgi:hypothetical protein